MSHDLRKLYKDPITGIELHFDAQRLWFGLEWKHKCNDKCIHNGVIHKTVRLGIPFFHIKIPMKLSTRYKTRENHDEP